MLNYLIRELYPQHLNISEIVHNIDYIITELIICDYLYYIMSKNLFLLFDPEKTIGASSISSHKRS